MKELSIEEKAKAYDEALEKAKMVLQERGNEPDGASVLSDLFPELTESEDERIRKDCIKYLDWEYQHCSTNEDKIKIEKCIDWLEKQGKENPLKGTLGDVFDDLKLGIDLSPKQGEQKPVDKVEPKFKVGDWIVRDSDGFTTSIESVRDEIYYFHQGGNLFVEDVDKSYNLWTIQDAMNGDVLVAHECLVLFKEIDGLNIRCYCTYHYLNHQKFYIDTLQNKTAFCPATKEQRDTLMKAMADAGYTFDFEKKELKKVEPNSAEDGDLPEFESYLCLMFQKFRTKGMCTNGEIIDYVKEHSQKLKDILVKPAWSEEDEDMLKSIIATCELAEQDRDSSPANHLLEMQTNWLKSLKERVQSQPKQEWGEEDEDIINKILCICDDFAKSFEISPASTKVIKEDVDKIDNWLKSLSLQKQ